MRRSRRVYQAQDCPDTSTASDVDDSDETRPRKRNANNDPSQPLTGLHLDSVVNGSQQLGGNGGQAAGETNDAETTDNSSIFARCLCCWRARTDTDITGENCVFTLVTGGSRISDCVAQCLTTGKPTVKLELVAELVILSLKS